MLNFERLKSTSVKQAAVLVSCLLLSGIGRSQTPNPPDPKTQQSTIETNVDEVSIDMVVRTKKNKPVLDLKPQDLSVTDDGTQAKISDLRIVSGNSEARHQISLLFDQLDASAANNARSIATKILKMVPDRGFDVSVLAISGRLRLFQEFTEDRDVVRKAVNLVTAENTTAWPDAVAAAEKVLITTVQRGAGASGSQVSAQDREMGRVLLSALESSQQNIQDHHMEAPLAGLQALARAQQRLPGRKVVIYFTQGLQANANTGDQLRAIAAAANRSGVSIYIINANGLDMRDYQSLVQTMVVGQAMSTRAMNPAPSSANLSGPPSTIDTTAPWVNRAVGDQLDRFESDGLQGHKDPLAGLAMNTGGSYVGSNENFRKPIKQMISDLSTYYEMSYTPPNRNYDGEFHSVKVISQRKDLRIRSRAGYFALPPSNDSQVRPFEAPILKAFSEPKLPSDLELHARILQLGNLSEGNTSALVVEAPLSQMTTRDDPNTNLYSLHAAIVAQIKNQAGAVVEHFSEDLPRRAALNTKEMTHAGFINLQRHFALQPGKYVLEAAVMDRYGEKIGAQRQDFDVTDSPSGSGLSDVMLVRRFDPLSEETDAFEPLRYKHGKVVPNVSGEIDPSTKDVSLFFLVHPDANTSGPAMLEMQVMRNGSLVGEVPLQLPSSSSGETIPYLASMKSSSLPPGNYQIIETLTQGDKVSERSTNFNIGGPELASAPGALAKPDPNDVEAVTEAGIEAARIASQQKPHLEITSLPAEAMARPSGEELESIIAGARKHALSYSKGLPNFICVEMTDRSVDSSGNGKWKHRDSLAELLRYRDNQESRTTIAVNGVRSSENREMMNGPLSLGEFGDLLGMIFQPAAKADFQWKETDMLGGSRVQVLSYRVVRENGTMTLRDGNGAFYAGFHGLIYIDSSTLGIRRVTMEADDLNEKSSIRAASLAVEYDYVAVGAHDYLMPVRGTIRLRKGKHESDLNEVIFQNYRRYASEAKIVAPPPR